MFLWAARGRWLWMGRCYSRFSFQPTQLNFEHVNFQNMKEQMTKTDLCQDLDSNFDPPTKRNDRCSTAAPRPSFDRETRSFLLPGETQLACLQWRRAFPLTQLDVALQCEQDVARFQVSVNDVALVEVDEGLESLFTHSSDLRLCQRSLQFCTRTQRGKHTHIRQKSSLRCGWLTFNVYALRQALFKV